MMTILSTERLYSINGGGKEDYDFGYTIGRTAKKVYNAVRDAFKKIKSWF